MKYVQLRDSSLPEDDVKFYAADSRRLIMVEQVANALFDEWFPNHPQRGPVGEDFDNWHDIALKDAEVAVKAMIKNAWIDDPEMDC